MPVGVRDLEYILGSTLKVRVLRSLIDLKKPVSGRHAGRLASVSQKATAALDELAKLGIINKAESTGQNLYSVNEEHYLAESLRALFRTEETKLEQIQKRISQAIAPRPGVVVGAIFGSVARGTAKPDSDLDVLVLIESARASDPIRDVLLELGDRLNVSYGSRISPIVLTVDQWCTLLAADDPFARSALSDARVFLGSFAAIGNNESTR